LATDIVCLDQPLCIETVSEHATQVCSVLAGVNGVARNASLYCAQIVGHPSDEVEWMLANDVNVINCSFTDANPNGVNKVILTKGKNYLDLSNPQEYIKYKILLANKNIICPSLTALKESPKATYRFVIVSEGEESKQAKTNMTNTMQCYKEYGKIEDNVDYLRMIVETLDGRPTSPTVKLEFLQNKCNTLIQSDPKKFLSVITDPLLSTKILIKLAIEEGLIANRGNYLYLRSDNTPLCEQNEEPTLNFAAKYLNAPKHQDILFALQAKLNK
jgi:hypothetical protein